MSDTVLSGFILLLSPHWDILGGIVIITIYKKLREDNKFARLVSSRGEI